MVMLWIGHENFQKWPDAQQALYYHESTFPAFLD
jgi:hypothetical protein